MINLILKTVFGTKNQRVLKKVDPIVEQINELEEETKKLSDEQLKNKTTEFKNRLKNEGRTMDDILPEAFACVREASVRAIKLRHYDVQLVGGLMLHQGRISEMKTGEGKTLVATLPAYLNALTDKGVHIVTVNDYLAKRDRDWMGPVFEMLGLTVGYVQHDMPNDERQQNYRCDITYVTNNEIGFDYLRDNMVIRKEDRVLQPLNYAIIDEVDSILIDEARTPLIISGPAEESTEKYSVANKLIPHLRGKFVTESEEMEAKYKGIDLAKGYDFIVDEKAHSVTLTEQGVAKCEKLLGVENLYDDIQSEWVHHVNQALRAHNLFKRDVDYVIKDGEVIIVDEFTGRLMPGRRWSDGLHQAVEAKENMRVAEENQTLATVTFQNYFRMYGKISGMTGTASTEAAEFWDIYKLDVIAIPSNKPNIRIDNSDVIYRTEKEKWSALVDDIEQSWKKGQPVLVGTRSIEKNEKLSGMLRRRGIPHQVLNAKFHEQEAQIISQAGKKGTVTVATNMAGRGVDIILGGTPPDSNEQQLVVDLGGLHVIGTERHDARRVDNQLRGRGGRQGDPGSTRFYISLEDELMRLFGGERMSGLMERLGMKEGENIEHPWITKAIENAQKKVEAMNFDIRKQLLEYDNVMNKQREAVYTLRNEILEGEDISTQIQDMINESIEEKAEQWASHKHPEEWDWQSLELWLKRVFDFSLGLTEEEILKFDKQYLTETLHEKIISVYKTREDNFGAGTIRELERMVLLHMIDVAWKEHLYEIDQVKKGIGLRAYGQKDPLIEYQKESYKIFSQMMTRIRESTVEYVFKIQPLTDTVRRAPVQQKNVPKMNINNTQKPQKQPEKPKIEPASKIGRNDPCICGSGKKYKRCCGINES
ncbi:MAG: preprotein translocase subunit SecA [Elusimicrobia bacterium RIFOXYA2_FULL_39_19]|nr:MAG: preprotein translocase subunit SecA [Elusimicrobia bacterium RIFOXYA2_FULL_39_19]